MTGPGRSALVGHTGFIGTNLAASTTFDDRFNSTNLPEIRGQHYDLVVSSAGGAESHLINRQGDQDRQQLEGIMGHLRSATIDKLVLISTVCVYPGGTTPDETTPVTEDGLLPYGANRAYLEQRLAEEFDTLVVRLPQLYGAKLAKGVVYDLLNDYRIEHLVPSARFQFYDLARLWTDIQTALGHSLPALNVAVPPMTNATIAREVFDRDLGRDDEPTGPEPYTKDMRTVHHQLFGGPSGYLMTADAALQDLRAFVATSSRRIEG